MFGYIVPISVFILLLVSSKDWIFTKNTYRPTCRGVIAIVCGLVALVYGWNQYVSEIEKTRSESEKIQSLLESIKQEGRRLQPSDFQFKLTGWAHGSAFVKSPSYEAPSRLGLRASVGDISITGQYIMIPSPAKEFPGGRSPNKSWSYNGTGLFVEGLNKDSYLDDLVGQILRIYIPRRALGTPFRSKLSFIEGSVSIKGRDFHFKMEKIESGLIDIQINENMLLYKDEMPNK